MATMIQFRMSSKEMVLITKALRGKFSDEDLPKMQALAERMLAAEAAMKKEQK